MNTITLNPPNEFWYHVSDQNEIPIAGITTRTFNIELFSSYLKTLPVNKLEFEKSLTDTLAKNIDYLDILRALVGISDKRMYLELSYLFSKARTNVRDKNSICGCSIYNLNKHPLQYFKNLAISKNKEISQKSLNLITQYLNRKGLYEILNSFRKSLKSEIEAIVNNLILTKELQQEEAKRRGHGAEFELAKLLHLIGCNLIPDDRYERAMASKDPNVDKKTFDLVKKDKQKTWSFDMLITENEKPTIFIQSLIHTSDPGQYGVNKSDETVQIKRSLIEHNRKFKATKELWGLVDGVGFSENKKDTINKMLNEFDCFIQLKSLYKAALKLHKNKRLKIKGIRFDKNFYTKEDDFLGMYEKYGSQDIKIVDTQEEGLSMGEEIKAGKAWVYL